jgi:hypothetical protein
METARVSAINPDEDKKKRRKILLLIPLIGLPLIAGGTIATIAAADMSSNAASSTDSAAAKKLDAGVPKLEAGALGDQPTQLLNPLPPINGGPGIPDGTDSDGGTGAPGGGGIGSPGNGGGVGSPATDAGSGDSGASKPGGNGGGSDAAGPGSGGGQGSVPNPPTSSTPAPSPSSTPGAGSTSTPMPTSTPGGGNTPTPVVTPTPGGDPTPDPSPTFGGGKTDDAQELPRAIQEYGYTALLHVTGKFDLAGAQWSIPQGVLPAGLTIDANTGTIGGLTTEKEGRYTFQVKVTSQSASLTGWFFIDVVPATGDGGQTPPGGSTPGGDTGSGGAPSEQPGGTPGDGTGTTPPGGSGGDSGADPSQPGGGTGDGGSGTQPGGTPGGSDGTGGTPGTGDGGSDGSTPTPTQTPTDNPGTGAPTDPGAGGGTNPDDPGQIDPGNGGSQSDVLTFDAPETLSVTVGSQIDQDLTASSSLGLAITYDSTGLPGWLTFVDGRLAGTAPTAEGSFTVTLTAVDAKHTMTRQVTVSVNPEELQVDTAGLSLSQGASGTIELHASNGASNASFTYRVTNPDSGTVTMDGPTLTASFGQPGNYNISVYVQDVNAPNSAGRTITIPVEVTPAPIVFTAGQVAATQYVAVSGKVQSASGGWGQYTYTVVGGALPAGVKLNPNGALSGNASTAGTYTATVQVTDLKGLAALSDLVIIVATNPAIAPTSMIQVGSGPIDEALSGDGARLFTVANIAKTLSVIDTATNSVPLTVPLTVVPTAVAVSPDGRYVAVGYASGTQVFDTSSYTLAATVLGTNVLDVAWSPDSAHLYALRGASSMAQFDIVSAANWAVQSTIKFGTSPYNWRLQELPGGHLLSNSGYGAAFFEIDPVAGTATASYSNAQGIGTLASAGDGTAWAATSAALRHVDIATKKVLSQADLGSGVSVTGMALSPDGQWLYLVSSSGSAIVFDTQANAVVARVPVDAAGGARLITSADGAHVYVAGGNGKTVITVLSPAQG